MIWSIKLVRKDCCLWSSSWFIIAWWLSCLSDELTMLPYESYWLTPSSIRLLSNPNELISNISRVSSTTMKGFSCDISINNWLKSSRAVWRILNACNWSKLICWRCFCVNSVFNDVPLSHFIFSFPHTWYFIIPYLYHYSLVVIDNANNVIWLRFKVVDGSVVRGDAKLRINKNGAS